MTGRIHVFRRSILLAAALMLAQLCLRSVSDEMFSTDYYPWIIGAVFAVITCAALVVDQVDETFLVGFLTFSILVLTELTLKLSGIEVRITKDQTISFISIVVYVIGAAGSFFGAVAAAMLTCIDIRKKIAQKWNSAEAEECRKNTVEASENRPRDKRIEKSRENPIQEADKTAGEQSPVPSGQRPDCNSSSQKLSAGSKSLPAAMISGESSQMPVQLRAGDDAMQTVQQVEKQEGRHAVRQPVDKKMRPGLCLYALLSAVSYAYLVMPERASISVVVFGVLQFICLWFLTADRRRLFGFIPVFALMLNAFISANDMWRISNVFVVIILYALILSPIDNRRGQWHAVREIFRRIACAPACFHLPFVWAAQSQRQKAALLRRILLAVLICVPVVIFLGGLLCMADLVFAKMLDRILSGLWSLFSINVVYKCLFGIIAGLYLTGLIYTTGHMRPAAREKAPGKQPDLLIVNIIFTVVVLIYTVFCVMQFTYLFARAALPYGMTYTEYARRGFFELLFLTVINLSAILAGIHISRKRQGKSAQLTRWLCCYLCVLTAVLLASSFYRMSLYISDAGLTRLRLMVIGFLIFEAVGLLATLIYCFRSKLPIITVYFGLALTYYMLLNLVPVDYFIARDQIDRYFADGQADIAYTLTLSSDAAPQIERLLMDPGAGQAERTLAMDYFADKDAFYQKQPRRWQRFNLSVYREQQIIAQLQQSR